MTVFDNKIQGGSLLDNISKFTGAKVKDGMLVLPESFGRGYIKTYELAGSMKVIVNEYELWKDITVKRSGEHAGKNIITFSFRNLFLEHSKSESVASRLATKLLPAVQVSSGDIDIEISVAANVKSNTILVIVPIDLLKDLLHKQTGNKLLENILAGNKPYLYEEIISPRIHDVASSIFEITAPEQLSNYFIRLKAEEMIYLFFIELFKRENTEEYPLNAADAKIMYAIKDKLLNDLSVQPTLTELTQFANMSESKMNRLFKQIFGASIYNYYQTLRMNEAAFLIREQKLSISETGYKLGFTNLSHFTRVFEKHHGITPKKFSVQFTKF